MSLSSTISKLIKKFEDPEHPSLGVLIPLLTWLGVWHPDSKSLSARFKIVFFYFMIAFFISQYVKFAANFNMLSIELFLKYAPYHLGVVKSCYFQKDYRSWEELVNYISGVEKKQLRTDDRVLHKIARAYLRWSRGVTFFFITLAFFSNIFIFMEPYQHQYIGNETVYMNMFDAYTPFSSEPPGYYWSLAVQTMFGYIMSIHIVFWDLTTVTIMIFFAGQLRISGLYCSRVIDVDPEISQRNIASCHQFHTTLVKYQEKFNALISPLMTLYLIIVSVNFGVGIIQLATIQDDVSTFVSTFIYLFACIIQLLLYYWHANEVTVESDRVSYSTFKSNWVEADLKLKRQLVLLSWTLNKRLWFAAGPFNKMSLDTFITILRRSYSFYTLLKETN